MSKATEVIEATYTFLYQPDPTKTISEDGYLRKDFILTPEQFKGILIFVYNWLGQHFEDHDKPYFMSTEHFIWRFRDGCPDNVDRDNRISVNIADFIVDGLLADSSQYGELPPFNSQTDDWIDYLYKLIPDLDMENLKPYTDVIAAPKGFPSLIMNYSKGDIITGVKIGSELFGVDVKDYIKYSFLL